MGVPAVAVTPSRRLAHPTRGSPPGRGAARQRRGPRGEPRLPTTGHPGRSSLSLLAPDPRCSRPRPSGVARRRVRPCSRREGCHSSGFHRSPSLLAAGRPTRSVWMQATRRSPARGRTAQHSPYAVLAQESRSVHRLLYLAAVRIGCYKQEHRQCVVESRSERRHNTTWVET